MASLIPIEQKCWVKTLNGLSDYYTEHRAHIYLIIPAQARVVLIGDSLAAGISRYADLWKEFLD